MELLAHSLRELEEAQDSAWAAQCFAQIVSVAKGYYTHDQIIPSISSFTSSSPFGSAGVKLMVELRRSLSGNENARKQLWPLVGILLFWALELQLATKSQTPTAARKRVVVDDSQFESQLNLVLDFIMQNRFAHEDLPLHLDTFFARALSVTQPTQRLSEAVENSLERFVQRLRDAETQFDPFCRAIALKAPRLSVPCLLRATLNRMSGNSFDAVLCRLVSFLLGTLDFSARNNNSIEQEISAELVRGDYNLIRTTSNNLLQARGSELEETCLLHLLGKLYCAVYSKWQVLLERTPTTVALTIAKAMEYFLSKLSKARRIADDSIVHSLTQAVSVLLLTDHTAGDGGSNTTLQTFKQRVEESNALRTCALRVNLQLCFHSESPQSELFNLALTSNSKSTPCTSELVSLVILALGFESTTDLGNLDDNFEHLLFAKLRKLMSENETVVLWSAGEFALEIYAGAYRIERWCFSFTLAARRMRELQRPSTAAQDKLVLLFQGFQGLNEVKTSIRHLQDLAWYFISFGKREAFSIASEKFLCDVALALFDLKRYWECGNVYVMLGTCDLACKRFTASSEHFMHACEAYDKLGLAFESNKVRMACRVFSKQSQFPREWDWCMLDDRASKQHSFAHYFLVGAVGIGDADLTIVRIVLRSSQLHSQAFDEAIRYLESGSFRRRITGQLRWDESTLEPRFFPSEMVGQDEFGFWIQRVWPLQGEENQVEHCCTKWGIVGQQNVMVQVKDKKRGLNALISACSVTTERSSPCALDIPVNWEEEMTEKIPLPLSPVPQLSNKNNDNNQSFFPANESASFHDSYAPTVSYIPDEEEEDIAPPNSPPPSDLDIQPPSSPPPSASSFEFSSSPVTPPSLLSEAERRKREFRQRREKEASAAAALQEQAEEQRRRQQALRAQQDAERLLLEQQQQQDAEAKRLRKEAKRKQVEEAAAAAALAKQQDEILQQQAEEDARRAAKLLKAQQDREREEQLALKQQMEAQYRLDQQAKLEQSRIQQEEEDEANRMAQLREAEEEHYRMQEQKRKLKFQQQQQQQNQSMNDSLPRRSMVFDDSPQQQDSTTMSSPGKGDMLIFKRKQQQQQAPSAATTPKQSSSFSRKIVLVPATGNNSTLEHVMQRTSPPKNLFNVGGARISLEEWEQLEKYKQKGEGWLSATVLSQGVVSMRFSAKGTVELFLEPKFQLIRTVNGAHLANKEGTNVIELRGDDQDPVLLICPQPEMLRALLISFS